MAKSEKCTKKEQKKKEALGNKRLKGDTPLNQNLNFPSPKRKTTNTTDFLFHCIFIFHQFLKVKWIVASGWMLQFFIYALICQLLSLMKSIFVDQQGSLDLLGSSLSTLGLCWRAQLQAGSSFLSKLPKC